MKIISAKYILTPDSLLQNHAIAFDDTIKAIDTKENILARFSNATVIETSPNALVMPGLINAHVHLEFSSNRHTLEYGSFLPWLYSVIDNRDELINDCTKSCIDKALDTMLHTGITTIGAISSYAMDLEACIDAKQNVIFFNELIGSQAAMADALFEDFIARLDSAKSVKRRGFYPAIAIHSPYSVHPILIKRALEIAKNEKLHVSAHLLESPQEREWLDASSGEFKAFFRDFLQQHTSLMQADEFIALFQAVPTLFTHAVQTNERELSLLKEGKHSVIHCPISNRLLGNGALDIDALESENIPMLLGTDGLSSNYTLNLFEEMKIALFMHSDKPLEQLAKKLLQAATIDAARALNLNTGEIAVGKDADMLVMDVERLEDSQLILHLLLQQYNIDQIFIHGEKVK